MENMTTQEAIFTQRFVENGKYGVKDNSGNVLIPAMFDEIGTLWSEEYKKSPCIVYIDDKAGLVSPDGKGTMLVECKYKYGRAIEWSKFYAFQDMDGNWGVIGSDGKTYVPFKYDSISQEKCDGYIFFEKGDKCGVFATNYNLVTDAIFDDIIEGAADEYLKMEKDGKEGYVTVDGLFISCEDYEADEEMDVELVGDFWCFEE